MLGAIDALAANMATLGGLTSAYSTIAVGVHSAVDRARKSPLMSESGLKENRSG